MMNQRMPESEILNKFAEVVSSALRVDTERVTPDVYLDELGAESLDLIEITMETEQQFNIFLPDKSILDTAIEVFGPGVLEKDGYLTEEGKRLIAARMPSDDAGQFEGEIAVKDFKRYFLKVSTWVRMIDGLLEFAPQRCEACGGKMVASMGFRSKCSSCGQEITLRSGEEINREWVERYHQTEYLGRSVPQGLRAAAAH